MSMKTLESAILVELREVTGVNKLRKKDIQEWSTGSVSVEGDCETLIYLPNLKVNCAVLTSALPKKRTK